VKRLIDGCAVCNLPLRLHSADELARGCKRPAVQVAICSVGGCREPGIYVERDGWRCPRHRPVAPRARQEKLL
jgi:hypothetical protein